MRRTSLFSLTLAFLFGSAIFATSHLHADDDSERGEYSFKWLDPDKKIYVLQNRKYLKTNRVTLSGMLGVALSSDYRNTYNFDFRAAYDFNEDLGIEGFYMVSTNSTNNTWDALTTASGSSAIPVVREITGQVGGLLVWSPWYAKINVFNNILYFDWYFSAGAGQVISDLDTNTVNGSAPNLVEEKIFSFFLGTGHKFHLSDSTLFRIDFMGAIYRAPSFGNTGDDLWFTNYNFNVGIGLKL